MSRTPSRVLVLGCGSVAQCTVPLLLRDLEIDPSRVTIVDFVDNRARVASSLSAGVRYEQDRLTPDNLDSFLSARVGDGDLLLFPLLFLPSKMAKCSAVKLSQMRKLTKIDNDF